MNRIKKNLFSIILLILIITVFVVNANIFENLWGRIYQQEWDIKDLKKIDKDDWTELNQTAAIHLLLSSELVNIMNQYNLNRYTDCESIKNRLSDVKFAFSLFDKEETPGAIFSNKIKLLKETNKSKSELVKDLDYIEFCLNQPEADTKN